ncbi:MAG: MerR family transcriptional regulator [Cyanobacteria bacterium P01_A01_bin.80]
MLKIGDFSKLSQVTVKALRLYDQLGLLKPADIDVFTGYRYYSVQQLPRINRILAFKDLGFSLEQIAKLLDDNLPPAEIRGMFRLKQAELNKLLEEEQARLLRVETRLKQIEREDTMTNYEVVIKKIEPVKVAGIRDIMPNYGEMSQLYEELFGYFQQHGIKVNDYCAGILHDPEYKESDVDVEAVVSVLGAVLILENLQQKGIEVSDYFKESDIDLEAVAKFDGAVPITERIKVYELPGYKQAACVIHQGTYNTINQAYTALLSWIENNGYKIIDSNREVYIVGGNEQDNDSYVTELQFPISFK